MAAPTPGAPANAPSAVTALVCGLLALFCFGILAGIPAVIFGNRTVREVEASGGQLGGKGMGRFAQIVGWLTILVYPLVAIGSIVVVTFLGK
jgi:hypothetical protein